MDNNNKKKMNILLFLPAEISTDIFSRLPIASIKQCKLVCKTWQALIEGPVFIDTYTRRLLLHYHDDGSVVTSVGILLHTQSYDKVGEELLQFAEYNDDDDKFKVYKDSKPIDPQLPFTKLLHRYFLGSCNGLVCFRSTALSSHSTLMEDICTQVCNPFIGEYVTLPTLSFERALAYSFSYIASGFGYHPSTKEYKVVRIVYFQGQRSMGHVFVYTLGSGTGCWRRKGEIKHRLCSSSRNDSIGYNASGALHWLNENMEIISFDLAVEEFRTLPSPVPPPIWGDDHYCGYDLGVLGGCLCMSITTKVCPRKTILNTWVMLMNKESKEYFWIQKFSTPSGKTYDNLPSDYVPLAILKSGRILLRYNGNNIHCYDPKTKRLVPTECCFGNDRKQAEIIPYTRSLICLVEVYGRKDVTQGNQNDICLKTQDLVMASVRLVLNYSC